MLDFDDLSALAARCLAADGGMPFAGEPAFLRVRWSGPEVATRAVRDAGGRLVAAGALRPGPTYVGLVDPAARGRGHGAALLDWGLGHGPGVTVETEGVTPDAEALFASRGLTQVFAEDVMRLYVTGPAEPPSWPDGVTLRAWDADSAPRFHATYEASFRDRPGFPGTPAAEWIADYADDEDFQPRWSVLASLPGRGEVGFVTAAVGWIVQVGVVPAARRTGLGAALVREAVARMRADGGSEVWLDVNVNNPARRLYERLGFVGRGRRARYRSG